MNPLRPCHEGDRHLRHSHVEPCQLQPVAKQFYARYAVAGIRDAVGGEEPGRKPTFDPILGGHAGHSLQKAVTEGRERGYWKAPSPCRPLAVLIPCNFSAPCAIFWKFSGRSSRLVDVARALFQIAPVTRD